MLTRYHDEATGATFDLLPAIDLRNGRVVRLEQGDFNRETDYGDDPVKVAAQFARDGATWLHVVDLDGAREGGPRQLDMVRSILERVGESVRVEVAGGLRSPGAVEAVLEAGAARAIVGTAALRDPTFAGRLVERHGADRIAVAIDVRGGLAVGDAWRKGAPGLPVEEAVRRLASVGVSVLEVTAVARDGRLAGPDLDLLRRVVALDAGDVIASGGVACADDVLAVRSLGCTGAIVGRALYDGKLGIKDVLTAIGGSPGSPRAGRRGRGW